MFKEIEKCRICGSKKLNKVLSLGNQYLTGVFPDSLNYELTKGPMDLVLCSNCGLLQMKQTYDLKEMYGVNYGYRSGLNKSMVKHLSDKVRKLEELVKLTPDDIVLDIGSNDATTLKSYKTKCKRIGCDPSAVKFKDFYTDDISLITDFFSYDLLKDYFKEKKAKIITSIAMFYDLEDPNKFVNEIEKCLSDDGIWHFEQSYMPIMLKNNSYDTVCQEHLEYYSFFVISNLLKANKLKIIDVELNDTNGGSFAVTACKESSNFPVCHEAINAIERFENKENVREIERYKDFETKVFEHKEKLRALLITLSKEGKKVFGYGASTKGNVILQFCNIGKDLLPYIVEVNPDKFGHYTPGTNIPIISESEAKKMNPDYYLVLPWHFEENIIEKEQDFLKKGGKFIFPLPRIKII